MQPEALKLLDDVRQAAERVVEFSTGRTLDEFKHDQLLRSAIYFQFLILGEALSQLKRFDHDTTDRISDSSRIIGFRNQVIHGYQKIDDEITWRIISTKVPILQ